MRLTSEGQVAIPHRIREILGLTPETEVDFVEENGRFYNVKTEAPRPTQTVKRLRDIATKPAHNQ